MIARTNRPAEPTKSDEVGRDVGELDSPQRMTSRFGGVWVLAVALFVAAVGIVASTFAAQTVARGDASNAREEFDRASAGVVAQVQLALRLEDGLAASGAAYFAEHPSADSAHLRSWLQNLQAFQRYPELSSGILITVVPQPELPAFLKRLQADTEQSHGAPVVVTPPGTRPFYCLANAAVARDTWDLPSGLDLCAYDSAGPIGASLFEARDTGQRTHLAVTRGSVTAVVVQAPAYRNGVVPPSVAERRAAFLGSFAITTDANAMLADALQGTANIAATLRYREGSSDFAFSVRDIPVNAQSKMMNLRDGWTIETFGSASRVTMWTDPNATLLFVACSAASLAAALLIIVLSSSRARALGLVRARTEQLRHQALHDVLTGLPNRALILDRADQMLRRAKRDGGQVSALFMDVDGFKGINDSLGHSVGDALLVSVADRLRAALRDADSIGRIGGDEFIVLLDNPEMDGTPQVVARRLLEVMSTPFELEGADQPLYVGISVGIAFAQSDQADELLRDADTALYQAKSRGKNRCEIFHPDMESARSRRLGLDIDLRSALRAGHLQLFYQPIFDLAEFKVAGVEALLRWNHPTYGLIGPDQFVPTLERTGQIDQVGRWVLGETCRQVAAWQARGVELRASVNVSALQLDDERVITDVARALDDSGLDPDQLILEITETALMRDVSATSRRLHALKKLGVAIAIDDFGTGHSSLAYLHQFPVDYLKIDRMFTRSITDIPGSVPLIISLVYLARSLGLTTIAEGVETTRELDAIRALRVDQAQGYLFSRPVEADQIETTLFAGPVTTTDPEPATA